MAMPLTDEKLQEIREIWKAHDEDVCECAYPAKIDVLHLLDEIDRLHDELEHCKQALEDEF